MLIRKEFVFDAAHNLIQYHGKCEKLHGHTYRLAVILKGRPANDDMIIDFCEVSSLVKQNVVEILDHAYINDIIPQPTAENIAIWVWKQIEPHLKRDNCALDAIEVWETATSCAVLSAEDMKGRGNLA